MSGLISALNVGKTSLATSQKAIEITGNNIANVNTPGYSRQIPLLSSYPTVQINGLSFGNGVKIDDVMRNHDTFLARQINGQSATAGESNARTIPLAEIEQVISISENGIAGEMGRFFDAWQELGSDPANGILRDLVLQRGTTMAQSFKNAVRDLSTVRDNINISLESKVEGVNLKVHEFAALNQRITALEATGQGALSDRDRRDVLLGELSASLGVSYFEGEGGMVSLQLPGGHSLVQGGAALTLEVVRVNGDVQFGLRTDAGSFIDLNVNNIGGEFRGLMGVRDQEIPKVIDQLDKLAYNLLSEVNTQHRAGTGLDGVSGRDFFTPLAAVAGAANLIAVALTQTGQVAAGTGASPGDNRNALQLAGLRNQKLIDGQETFTSYYANLATRLGTEIAQNRLTRQGSEDALLQLQNRRDSTAGVSLEEEMINLIKFQKGFEASAKLLATVDEMMDSLLALKR